MAWIKCPGCGKEFYQVELDETVCIDCMGFESFASQCNHCRKDSPSSDYGVYYCKELDGCCDIQKCPYFGK
jgi:hypothetical protein